MKRRPGRPRALSTAGTVYARVERDDRHDPPPGKDWIRFDFPPAASAEEITRVLLESLAKHPPQGDGDDEDELLG